MTDDLLPAAGDVPSPPRTPDGVCDVVRRKGGTPGPSADAPLRGSTDAGSPA